MPRPEGIATFLSKIDKASGKTSRNECPDQRGLRLAESGRFYFSGLVPERMPRPEGIATCSSLPSPLPSSSAGTNAPTRGDCDTIQPFYAGVHETAGTNAPTRGDCDSLSWQLNVSSTSAGTNAPTRGDCDLSVVTIAVFMVNAGTNAPTRGDCDTSPNLSTNSSLCAGTNAPTRGDCDCSPSFVHTTYRLPERMPRPEGIATCGDSDRFFTGPGRNECPDQRGLRHNNCRLQ